MSASKDITAKDGADFYLHLAAFAFDMFVDKGVGCVLLREGDLDRKPDGSVEARVTYLPYEIDNDEIPPEAVEMINEYEPESEIVFVTIDHTDTALCLKLTAKQIGCSPVTAAMKGREWHVAFDPGAAAKRMPRRVRYARST